MCGIAGIFDTRGRADIDRALIGRMTDSLRHRGPDEGALHVEPGLALGHRRLSIIDVANGQQPLFDSQGEVGVVYNGEIYNFAAVREELIGLGHAFQTNCDTEVIVYAWREWGERCVERFRGMFAFALWDRRQETLFLARDRIGIKPLYYAVLPDGHFIFASELKGLFAHPRLARDPDPQAIEDYFAYGYIPDPKTIVRAARKLPPGHTITLRRCAPVPAPVQYWDVAFDGNGTAGEPESALAEALIEKLREAVRIRLISEVPLGAFLSGGIDSSAVVAMMAGLGDAPVNTCSIGFEDPRYNESAYAARVAERYRTEHFVEDVDPDDFALVDKLMDFYDEPFADSSAIPTYRLCELARKRVTVALSGDGGDENLAGYRRYRLHMAEERVRGAIPRAIRAGLFGPLAALYPKADWAPRVLRAKTTFQALAMETLEAYFHTVSLYSDAQRERLFSAAFKRDLQGYNAVEVFRGHAARSTSDHPLSLAQYLDIKCYLPGDILVKVDRASMAHSLEVRVPLLDHELVEWIAGLAPALKLNGHGGKYLFKRALGDYLGDDILYRPKMGFEIPVASWFRGPLAGALREAVLGSTLADCGVFDRPYLTELVEQHQSGRRDNSTLLWPLVMFESYLRKAEA